MTDYDAVLFDNDGILVEPPALETKVAAARDAFRELGVADVDRDHLVALVSGATVDELEAIAGAYDLDPTALWKARERHDERSQVEAFERGDRDAYDDVEAVATLAGPRGVVSNNHHATLEFVLDHFDLEPLFDTYRGRPTTVESLSLKKPDPHYLDLALADLGVQSGLYVGDYERDVVAAHRAGLDAAFVRRPHNRDATLSTTPTHEVADLHELAALLTDR